MRLINWLRRLWPGHEHLYSQVTHVDGELLEVPTFRCRCGDGIEGHELFKADSMMGRYWREQYP